MKFVEGLNDTFIKGELMMNQTNGQAPRIIIQVLYPMSYLATVFEPV